MPRVRVHLFGHARVEVDGYPVSLTPLTKRLLLRLIAAEGEPVTSQTLYKDVWGYPTELRASYKLRIRNDVQKRIHELRRALDGAGADTTYLQTEQMLSGTGAETAYRLVLAPDEIDVTEFASLVNEAVDEPPASALGKLTQAVELWHGGLTDAQDGYLASLISRLNHLYRTARSELIRVHTDLGRPDLALPIAKQMVDEDPEDAAAQTVLKELRAQLRASRADELLRCELPAMHTTVTVVRADLFDQLDADWVVGATDVLDTARDGDLMSSSSLRGQLVDRAFEGDTQALDRMLSRQLRGAGAAASLQPSERSLATHPVGTVVPLAIDGRRVFALVLARHTDDLIAKTTEQDLRDSLDSLWKAVARYGTYRPVAVPVLGARLNPSLPRGQVIAIVVDSFLRHARASRPPAPSLRIVVQPHSLGQTDFSGVVRLVAGFNDGR